MKHFDHINTNESMFAALSVLNQAILNLTNCEDTARCEAIEVAKLLSKGGLTSAELTDYLHQAAIDYRSNIIRG